MMQTKIYLDTNIVADMIDSSRKNYELALKLLKDSVINNYELCISQDMISTLYYISKDKPATLAFVKNIILEDWKILSFEKEIIADSINLSLEKNIDLEDILQCLCAKKNKCDFLLTSDIKFYNCNIKIKTIEEFLK